MKDGGGVDSYRCTRPRWARSRPWAHTFDARPGRAGARAGRGGGQEWKERDARAISVTCRSKSAKCCITQFMHETWRYRPIERGTAPAENTRTGPSTPNTTLDPPEPRPGEHTHPRPGHENAGRAPHGHHGERRGGLGAHRESHRDENAPAKPGRREDTHRGRPARALRPGARSQSAPQSPPDTRGPSSTHHRRHDDPTDENPRQSGCTRSRHALAAHRPKIRPCPRVRSGTRLDFGGITPGHRTLTAPPYRRYRAAADRRRPVRSPCGRTVRRSDRRERTRSTPAVHRAPPIALEEPLEGPGWPAQGPQNTKTPSPQAFPHRR